jgi:hypothetical protein
MFCSKRDEVLTHLAEIVAEIERWEAICEERYHLLPPKGAQQMRKNPTVNGAQIEATAGRMLARHKTAPKATEAALDCRQSYGFDSDGWAYWDAVLIEIRRLAKEAPKPREFGPDRGTCFSEFWNEEEQ